MAQNQQPTPEQLAQLQRQKNEQFMSLTYEQPIKANAQNGTAYGLGKSLQYDSPIVASAWATKVTLRFTGSIKTAATGTIKPTASYPYSLLGNNVILTYGSKVATFHPYLAKIRAMLEGYARTEFDNAKGYKSSEIDALLRTIPTTFEADTTYPISFDVDYELNAINPVSVNGLLGIFSSGVRLQTSINTPNSIIAANADALDHAFEGTNAVEVTGNVEVIINYRDNNSMATRQNMELDISGLPTVQCIQLPTANLLAQGTYNTVSIRNPYPIVELHHIVCDGVQSDKFASPSNIKGYFLGKDDNSNNTLLRWDETTGGVVNMFKKQREKFGTDLPEGVISHSFSTENLANVSSKTGGAFFNATGEGYPSATFGVKLNQVNNTDRVSKIVSYAIILNGEGIQTR